MVNKDDEGWQYPDIYYFYLKLILRPEDKTEGHNYLCF